MLILGAIAAIGVEVGSVEWKHVRPIIEQHCLSCHHDGGPAPFALHDPESVALRARFIKEVTTSGLMPPWIASEYGLPLQDERGLSDHEIGILAAWADNAHPMGDDLKPAKRPPESPAKDDVVVTMPETWTVPAEGKENWGRRDRDKWTFVLPIGNDDAIHVRGIQHYSTAPQVVHAVTYLADPTDASQWKDSRDDMFGTYMTGDIRDRPSGELGGTGVGHRKLRLPEGFHWDVPRGSDLAMEVHYRPLGRPLRLQDRIAFEVTADQNSRPLRTLISMVRWIDVASGASSTVEDQFVLEEDVQLVGITPRAMGTCTALRLTASLPHGEEVILFDAPDWDPHWRQTFLLEDVYELPLGTVIRGTWRIVNTEGNLRNPFVPIERLSMARRTGAVSILLHVAAEDPEADQRLQGWHRELMRSRMR